MHLELLGRVREVLHPIDAHMHASDRVFVQLLQPLRLLRLHPTSTNASISPADRQMTNFETDDSFEKSQVIRTKFRQ